MSQAAFASNGAISSTNGAHNSAADEPPGIYKSPIVFCVFVLGFEFYVYNAIYLNRILPQLGKLDMILVYATLFNMAWFMTAWCYASVHCAEPGWINDQWRAFVHNTAGLDVIVSRQEWQPGKCTTNKKSAEIRPERAHFCSTTRKDVLRMDHFCPWTGNCIGQNNHKHFLLLGFYGSISGIVGFLTALPDLLGCTTGYAENAYIWQNVSVADRTCFIAFGVLAFLVMILLTGLITSHFPLACRNMTTIEELYTWGKDTAQPVSQIEGNDIRPVWAQWKTNFRAASTSSIGANKAEARFTGNSVNNGGVSWTTTLSSRMMSRKTLGWDDKMH